MAPDAGYPVLVFQATSSLKVGHGAVLVLAATLCGAARPEVGPMAASPGGQGEPGASPSRVNVERLIEDVRTLSSPDFEGRLTGSPGRPKAQAFILRRFRDLGLEPAVPRPGGLSYEQPFSFTQPGGGGPGHDRPLRSRFPDATNLMGAIAGSVDAERFTTLTAHYDHLGVRDGRIYPGADDDASGVAAMLAAAEHFAQHRPRRSILFIAFDGEEEGLQGSKFFIANPPLSLSRIVLAVNLDMVARSDRHELIAAGTSYSPGLRERLTEVARGRRLTLLFGHDRPSYGVGAQEDWTGASDHGSFHAAGVPFIYFAVENHPDYHRPTDTVDRISPEFFAEAANLIVDTLLAFDSR